MSFNRFRSSAALTAAALAFLSACSADSASSPLGNNTEVSAAVLAGNPYVIVGDAPVLAGSFSNAVVNNSGREGSEFWDNLSADTEGGPEQCNIGWYAIGAISPTCINDDGNALLSDAGSTGGFTKFLGDAGGQDATGFMFAGGSTYDVTLRGSYAGSESTVGWYTKSSTGDYTFHPVTEWTTQQLGFTVTINTLGQQWGLYISNNFNPQPDGCGVDTFCSDADGGFTGAGLPFNQFALFSNAAGSDYLVGAEDNKLETFVGNPAKLYDSDYNDYLWTVTPKSVCDFITFGRIVTSVNGKKVVISGNAGGIGANGAIMGEFHIDIDGTDYHVSDPATYGPISLGALSGYTNARVVTGTAKNGASVELRLWDGGEPGKNTDRVYVKINGVEYLGTAGKLIDQGNMQYHPTCRGPG